MKTKLTLVVAAIAVLTLSNLPSADAQSWNLTGNSNATSSSKLGTTNNNPLRFFTNNVERMRITPDGSVGIGTSSPGTKLEIKSILSQLVKFNGASSSMYMGLYENGVYRGYIGSYAGNNEDVDFGTGAGTAGKLHLTIQASPKLTIDQNGRVGIGTTAPSKRLYVTNPGTYTEDNTAGGDAIIVRATGSGACWGVNASSVNSTAVNASASAGIGVNASSTDGVGVNAFSSNTHGIHAYSLNNIGIFAETGNPGPSYAGWFQGDVEITGTLFGGSDRKLKQNIVDFTSAMRIINQLHPKEYEFRHDGNFQLMNLPRGMHYGLIAQDVEQVLPNLVKEAKFNTANASSAIAASTGKVQSGAVKGEVIDYKGLNYIELIPIVIGGLQELSKQNQELSAKNEDLQKQINELKSVKTAGTESSVSEQSATNSMLSSAFLDQNKPNPFAGATSIRYNLPAGSKVARMVITDNGGKTIKQVQLYTAGNNTVNIDASTLTSGTYNYSLLVDGKVIESKKMIVITH